MRIAIADNNNKKFTGDLIDHWKELGHEVKFEMGASEKLAQWADLYFIDFWDNNIHYLYRWYQEHKTAHKPKICVRAVDWEVWQGLARDQKIIDWVDVTICIAPHIERKLRSENDWHNLHLIKCGVDTEKFPLRNEGLGTNILIPCNEIDWHLKNTSEGFKIFAMLVKKYPEVNWRLGIKGKWTQAPYFKVFHLDLLKKLGIENRTTIIDEHVDNYNQFLEQFDYCLLPSYKEAYSYVTAECASKGIKPVLNHWYGAEELWPKNWLYRTPEEAVKMLVREYDPRDIRRWVVKNSNIQEMFAQFDELLGL